MDNAFDYAILDSMSYPFPATAATRNRALPRLVNRLHSLFSGFSLPDQCGAHRGVAVRPEVG